MTDTTTDTTTSTTDVAPPRDYPHDTWVDDAGDEYYVPEQWRPFYAQAEPTEQARNGYIQFGSSIVEDLHHDQPRLVAQGRLDADDVVTYEDRVVPTFVDISGASGYPRWLHRERLTIAAARKKSTDVRAAMEARWVSCSVCGTRDGSVTSTTVIDPSRMTRRVLVVGCPACLPVLTETARAHLAARAADRRTDDGRRVGDIAAQLVAAQVDDNNRDEGAA